MINDARPEGYSRHETSCGDDSIFRAGQQQHVHFDGICSRAGAGRTGGTHRHFLPPKQRGTQRSKQYERPDQEVRMPENKSKHPLRCTVVTGTRMHVHTLRFLVLFVLHL